MSLLPTESKPRYGVSRSGYAGRKDHPEQQQLLFAFLAWAYTNVDVPSKPCPGFMAEPDRCWRMV